MTMQEKTGIRDLTMSQWVRKSLPDSSLGFLVTDLDFILYNFTTKKVMLVEVKTRNARLKKWQETIFSQLARWIKTGIDKEWEFLGFHLITFENTFFNDGNVYLDGVKTTETEVRNFLSTI
jgi:hypothetical protein